MTGNLLTEARNPASARIDTLPTDRIVAIINDEDAKVPPAVRAVLPQISSAVDAVTYALQNGGKLFYIGAGTSGRLGVLDASECPPTFNVAPDLVQGIIAGGAEALSRATEASEDDRESGVRDLVARQFSARDVLCGIAASGRTPYVLGAIAKAKELGATTIGISCTPQSELSAAVQIPIEVLTGPEVVTGSTRMKAGTATKLVLNTISTAVMIRLGHVYGNLMVNVRPKNDKLRDRALRIIRDATDANETRAAQLFEQSAGDVRTAIIMGLCRISREEASALLASQGGSIRASLALLPSTDNPKR
ncbi:MAG: N-acetylmuramic acid 6-phosphate etherase [Bryobacteraceae bacterium]|nr:N-acetylmuramic acid 6-phosphate etherase [Bryobacteraceae bacterium]